MDAAGIASGGRSGLALNWIGLDYGAVGHGRAMGAQYGGLRSAWSCGVGFRSGVFVRVRVQGPEPESVLGFGLGRLSAEARSIEMRCAGMASLRLHRTCATFNVQSTVLTDWWMMDSEFRSLARAHRCGRRSRTQSVLAVNVGGSRILGCGRDWRGPGARSERVDSVDLKYGRGLGHV